MLGVLGSSFLKCNSPYREYYDNMKNRLNAEDWGIESKQLEVSYNPDEIELIAIHKAIASVGHNTRLVKAPDDVYEKLPACCLYRTEKIN